MTSKLTGFSPRSARRVAGVWTVFVLASAGWALGGQLGAVMAVVVGVALVFVQWWGQPAWSWAVLGLRGRRPVKWNDPITLANNRSGGGVRVQDGVAVVAVQLLGRAHLATTVTGSVTVESDNVIDVVELAPLLRHPLDLELDSISVVTFGSRTGTVGDYPRVYDAEIGTPPYAGRRETWLIMRLPVIGNTQALRWRTSVGAAAISVAQRVATAVTAAAMSRMVDTMGDLLTARRHFDRAMTIKNGQGCVAALPEFVAATEADPSMADAWLGRIACGDRDLASLKQLNAHSEWLHRETTRIGRTLAAEVQLGPSIGITVTDASQVGLALSSALTIAGEYAKADALLANRELLDSWRNYQWHQLARAFLMYVTQRWPDVLSTAAEDLPPQAIVMPAVTASICALAAHAAAHLGQGRVALDWLDRVDVIGHSRSSGRFGADVLTAAIGPADIPLLVADLAYVRGMVYRQLHEEDKAQIWLSKATINGVLTDAAKEALADPNLRLIVTDERTIASRSDRWDASTAKSRDQLDDDNAAQRRGELLAEGRELLAKQVGLAAVKQAVSALEDQLEVRMMRLEHGLPVEGQTNHMLLVGPPGTGKTTTAEALGKIYAGMGIVRHPEIREVRRSDFCGHYIGESGPKTNELIEKSLGRIIFMDEFYSLIERHQDGTPDMIGMEAVNQLLVQLETHRFDFCFIGAGYEDQVDEFLTVNPGLAGRFNRKLRFESYSPVEIVEIGHRYATPRASQLDDAAREVFLDAVTTIRNYTTPSGQHGIDAMQNGRFARNVIERAEGFRDTRVVAQKRAGQPVSVQDLQIITATDIDAAIRSVCSDNRDMAAIVW